MITAIHTSIPTVKTNNKAFGIALGLIGLIVIGSYILIKCKDNKKEG